MDRHNTAMAGPLPRPAGPPFRRVAMLAALPWLLASAAQAAVVTASSLEALDSQTVSASGVATMTPDTELPVSAPATDRPAVRQSRRQPDGWVGHWVLASAPAVRLHPSGRLEIDHDADTGSAAPSAESVYMTAEQALFSRTAALAHAFAPTAVALSPDPSTGRSFESLLAGLLMPHQQTLTPSTLPPALQVASVPSSDKPTWLRSELLSLMDPPTVAFALLALLLVPLRRSRRRPDRTATWAQPDPPITAPVAQAANRRRHRLARLPVASPMR